MRWKILGTVNKRAFVHVSSGAVLYLRLNVITDESIYW